MLWLLNDAIQMGTHNICLYEEEDKQYTGCNLKTTELLDCALIRVCVAIRSSMVAFSLCKMIWVFTGHTS